jgi:branched-chain amino acid transport system substrate-binding protein
LRVIAFNYVTWEKTIMRTKQWLPFAALLLIVALLAAPTYSGVQTSSAQASGSMVVIPKGKTIKIGWAGDLTKQLIVPSKGILFGAQVAVNRRNAAGGIKGFNVEIVQGDDQCVGEQATTVAQKFASDPEILGVVGHVCSGATIPASDVYEKARIVMVSPSATAYAVTNRGLTVVNRVVFTDDKQGLADALYMINEVKAKTVATLDDSASYGKGLAETVQREFARLGGQVVLAESIDPEAKDYRPVLTKLLANPPDVLFFGGYEKPAALLTQQMKEVGLTNTTFFSDDGAYTSTYIQLAGKDAEGVLVSSVSVKASDEQALKAFEDEFAKVANDKYEVYDPYQPNGYDAASVIMNGIESVAKVDDKGDLTVDREALIKAVRATKDFKGLTGTLTCDSKGDCGAGEVAISEIKNSQWELRKKYTAEDLQAASEAAPAATMAATMSK